MQFELNLFCTSEQECNAQPSEGSRLGSYGMKLLFWMEDFTNSNENFSSLLSSGDDANSSKYSIEKPLMKSFYDWSNFQFLVSLGVWGSYK